MTKNETVVTPKGTAIFPTLNEPDKKFNPEGTYKVTLRLTEEEAAPLIAKLTKIHSEAQAVELKKLGKKNIKLAPMPWADATNYDKETETKVPVDGFVDFKFSLKAVVKTKAGKSWEQRPALFDAKLNPIPVDSDKVGGGSVIRVNAEVYPWFSASLGFGISLRCRSVQVLELKTYGSKDATSFGFSAEDGYETEGESNPFASKEQAAVGDGSPDF